MVVRRRTTIGFPLPTLQEGNHGLLLAPRRVGKTSLAIRVGADAKAHGWKFALIDVQKDREELGLLANLLEGMQTARIKMPLLPRLAEGVAVARHKVKGKVSGWGVALEINGDEKPETADLEKLIDRLFTEFLLRRYWHAREIA